ncbi:hypothetical protein Fcan01_24265 [Folsomia candida]|uniref:Uncharacterized protein n=1 Tax=Folsomia candida TaxID=158441 RepID=A0A226D828_FOLCA|nr:hypothetical protein Fcan01_24265 [Folsomia candida]
MVEQVVPSVRYRYIANLTSFNGFVAFWLLEDMMKHDYLKFDPRHSIPPIMKRPTYKFLGLIFVAHDIQKFSYLSCYQVKWTNSVILSELMAPYDIGVWLCILASLIAVIVLLIASLDNFISRGILLTVGICLENSVLGYLSTYKSIKYRVGVCTLITTLALLGGTLLSNFYKTYFTLEMIVPKMYQSPWNSVMNVEEIKILMPFDLLDEQDLQSANLSEYNRYMYFYQDILLQSSKVAQLGREYPRLNGYIKTANRLIKSLLPYFGVGTDGKNYFNGTFGFHPNRETQYNTSILREFPIQPISYKDHVALIKNLSTCGKIALVDTEDHITGLTPFLNDNSDHLIYLSGHEDVFFTAMNGWSIHPVRESYGAKRVKVLMSSGIFKYLKTLYSLLNPDRLFHHYASWTQPKLDSVTRLDLNSKVAAGLHVCGICLVVCILIFLVEVGWFRGYRLMEKYLATPK